MKSCTSYRSGRFIMAVLGCVTALVMALPGVSAAQDPCSVIVIDPPAPAAGQPFTICGPQGAQYYYSWRNNPADAVPFSLERCISFPNGLSAGSYSWEHTYSVDSNQNGPDPSDPFYKCLVELTIVETPQGLTCEGITIRPEGGVCENESRTLCAPVGDGYYYTWSDENGTELTHERCIEVSRAAGCYEYHITISDDLTGNGPSQDDPFVKCPVNVCFDECEVNCPRTVGFWGQQCLQRTGGSTKFTVDQMNQITGKVDDLSDFLSWGSDFESFCALINAPKPMNQRTQALRQFAGTLANVATGELGLIANNGNEIKLSLDTHVTCGGEDMTIGALIDLADARFAALAGASLSDEAVKAEYAKFIGCFDAINNGIGIGSVCSDETSSLSGAGLLRLTPNPLVDRTSIVYSVEIDGDMVDLAVYDVLGREVRVLERGVQSAGSYQTGWDGTGADGRNVRSGVYFVRGTIGGQRVNGRVMVVR